MKKSNSKKLTLTLETLVSLAATGPFSTRHTSCDDGGTDTDGTCIYRIGAGRERVV